MRKITTWIMIVVGITVMSACDDAGTANQAVMDNITFHKHANGLCFAVWQPTTMHRAGLANIPCQSGDTVFVR